MVLVLILTSTYSLLTKYPVSPYDTKQAGAILENRANKDVYYILLDSYPSDWVLKNYCGQKANGLTKFLELKGFSVADKSTSNYQETTMALYTTPVCQDHFLADLR